jgi:hypothetical protein
LKRFFLQGKAATTINMDIPVPASKRKFYLPAKIILILFLSWSVLSNYIQSGNFNDDQAARPPFHGAYEVETFIRNNDTLPPLLTDSSRFRRIFIHRRGYLIIQNMQDQMKDYLFRPDTVLKRWYFEEDRTGAERFFTYRTPGKEKIELNARLGTDSVKIILRKIDLSGLNLMKREFNWTMD